MWFCVRIAIKLQVVLFLYAEHMEHDDTNISDMLPFGEYRIDIATGFQLAARIRNWHIIVEAMLGHGRWSAMRSIYKSQKTAVLDGS